jgi:hypothetical protein
MERGIHMEIDKNVNQIFEINDSDINIKEIMYEIESRLKDRSISRNEIDKIVAYGQDIHSEIRYREFDPSFIAYQFETGISTPKFTNPKFWFIKGPIRKVITFFVEIYSAIEKRLSTNRVKAFYSVVYELMILRSRIEKLEKEIERLKLTPVPLETVDDATIELSRKNTELFLESDRQILSNLNPTDFVLVLCPISIEFTDKLNTHTKMSKIISYESVINKYTQPIKPKTKRNKTQEIELQQFTKIIIHQNLCTISHKVLEKLFLEIKREATPGTKVLARLSNYSVGQDTPFKEVYKTSIEIDSLYTYLRTLGFYNIVLQKIPSDYSVLSCYTGNENTTTRPTL